MKFSDINNTIALLILVLVYNPCHAERADRDKPVHLEADHVSIDDAKQISIFEGKVMLTQGTMTIQGSKIVVVQNKTGFAHGTTSGQPASYRQKREGDDEYVEGYAERIEYDSKTETIDFFGNARMVRNQDEVRGYHITYNSKTEIFQVQSAHNLPKNSTGTGRVRVTLQPKTNVPPPASESLRINPSDTLSKPNDRGGR
jgi:lipopolysaccharide export system protein LptA